MHKAIIFDFDGVIHDTFEFHRTKVSAFTGINFSVQEYQDVHNGNFYAHGNDQFKNTDWAAYVRSIFESFTSLKIKEEIKEALAALSKLYNMFIISSGGGKNISGFLENNGARELFQEVLGNDIYRSKVDKFKFLFQKYTLTPEDVVFVTDTLGDILEANEMNIKTIAMDFGFHPIETLEKGKPMKIVSSMNELVEAITSGV